MTKSANKRLTKRTWNYRGGTTAALLVNSRNVALQNPRPRLGKLGHVAQVVEHRLEDNIGVILRRPIANCETNGRNTHMYDTHKREAGVERVQRAFVSKSKKCSKKKLLGS